eukprot:GEMP01003587.1.p1 GENE.GEMP01003587.1~~GEMP01003587.1.p1  ORF type:complete len:750 (+),score=-9.50 GEMP01003587.1:84-2333(+)
MGAEEKAGIDQADAAYDAQKGMRVEEVEQRTEDEHSPRKHKSCILLEYANTECLALSKTPLAVSICQDEWMLEKKGELQDDGTRLQPRPKLKFAIGFHFAIFFMAVLSLYCKYDSDPESPNVTWQKTYFQWWAGLHFWPAHFCKMSPNWWSGNGDANRVLWHFALALIYIPLMFIGYNLMCHYDRLVMLDYTHKQIIIYVIVRWVPYFSTEWTLKLYFMCDGTEVSNVGACTMTHLAMLSWMWATIPMLFIDCFFLERNRNYRMESRWLYGFILFFWLFDTVFTTWLWIFKWFWWPCWRPWGPFKYYAPWDVLTRYNIDAMPDDSLTGVDKYIMANPVTFSLGGSWERNVLPWGWRKTFLGLGVGNLGALQASCLIPIFLGLIVPPLIRNYKHGSRNQPGDIVMYEDDDPRVQRPVEFMHFAGWIVAQWSFRIFFIHRLLSMEIFIFNGKKEFPGMNVLVYYGMFWFFKFCSIYSCRTAIGRTHYLCQIFPVQILESNVLIFFTYFYGSPWTYDWLLTVVLISVFSAYRDGFFQWHLRRVLISLGWMDQGLLEDLVFDEEMTLYDCQTCIAQCLAVGCVTLWALMDAVAQLFYGNGGTMYKACYRSGTGACRYTAANRLFSHLVCGLCIVGVAAVTAKWNLKRLSNRRNSYVQNNHHKKIDTSLEVSWKKPHDWIPRIIFYRTVEDFARNHLIKLEVYLCFASARVGSLLFWFCNPYIAGNTKDQLICNGRFWVTYFSTGVYDYRIDLW